MHEMICLFDISTMHYTADNAANIVEQQLIKSVLDKLISKIAKVKTAKSPKKLKQDSKKLSSLDETIIEPTNNNTVTAKKKKSKTVKKDTFYGKVKVEDLLDLQFFEKCFFGKKLTIKD